MGAGIKSIWRNLSVHRKRQFYLVFILMNLSSMMEVVSVGLVIPFLGVLSSPEQLYEHEAMSSLLGFFKISGPEELLLVITAMFVSAVLVAGIVRVTLLYVMTKFSYAIGADFNVKIYRNVLCQNYEFHSSKNSSEIISVIVTKTGSIIGIIKSLLMIGSSMILVFSIVIVLFLIDKSVALYSMMSFGVLYIVLSYYSRKHLESNSVIISEQSNKAIKSLQEGLGGIRDVLVDNNQDYYARLYKKADALVRDASGSNDFIISSPRFIMESAGMIFIACMAYVLSLDESEFQTAIPLLGALALGAQRILPALQQAYNGYSTIKGVSESYFDVMKLLEKKCDNGGVEYSGESVAFCNNIELKNVGFKYPGDARWLFNGFNLNIKKGSRVGFVGETGSGKSTLVDIIMGLWIPEKGSMLVDNVPIILDNRRLWQANISHVPQNIFLTDCTVRENIAFGVSEDDIDDARIIESAKKANIHSVIEGLPLKYETLVGERGVRLSGGQRQRLGIARALYKKANVLILDEATSALDNETEEAVMDAIKSLDNSMTIIIVAHRLTTIKDCDMVVNISRNGIITEINGGLK